MFPKDADTLVITAHGFKKGQDLTKDMRLEVKGNQVTVGQESFKASGTREDAVYSLKGVVDSTEYRFRLYTLGDKYVLFSA